MKGAEEQEYRELIAAFTGWSRTNGLILNTFKAKKMIVDFWQQRLPHKHIVIDGESTGIVPSYKYLRVHIDNKLDWSPHMNAVYKKGQSKFYFLRRLKSFTVCIFFTTLLWQVLCFSGWVVGETASL